MSVTTMEFAADAVTIRKQARVERAPLERASFVIIAPSPNAARANGRKTSTSDRRPRRRPKRISSIFSDFPASVLVGGGLIAHAPITRETHHSTTNHCLNHALRLRPAKAETISSPSKSPMLIKMPEFEMKRTGRGLFAPRPSHRLIDGLRQPQK